MGTQGTGRKRSTKKERSTAEDDALNLIAREAEARLAAKRAARAEAREIRMKELERQQKEKYYGLNTKVDDRSDSKWGDIEQWMEDSERYSRSSRIQTLSDDDERMSVGSRGSVRSDLDAAGAYSGASSLQKKSKKKKKHKHKDKDRNGYDDDYSVISSRSSRLSDDSRVLRGSRLDLQPASYASSDLYSLNGLSSSRNPGSTYNGYQPLEYSSYRSSGSRVSSRAGSARASPVDNCGSVASFLRSAASSSGLPRDLDDVTIPDFSDVEDRDYLEKGSRAASALTAATLTSLGGTSSRRGSGETAIIVDAENSIREIKEIHELKDQIQDVETKYTQNLKEVKDALAEVEEKYRKAMVSNAQLDNEKNNLMYQVDTLKDSLMELEELLSESRREYEEKVKEHEREKHAHGVLQFQFNEMKETLKQSEELLNEIRQLRIKQEGFGREISDLQETVEWKDKKIGALERQKEYTDAIRVERDELREEVVTLKDILKKHGIVLGPDLNINGEVGEADVDGSPSADTASQSAPDSQALPAEGNSMLGNTEETELSSNREEEEDPEQQQEKLEEAKENHLSSDTLCNVADVSTLETSSKEEPSEERQTCLPIEEDSVGDRSLSNDLNVDVNDCPTTETKDIVVCSPEPPQVQDATCPEENAPETGISERVKLEETSYQDLETETKSSRFDTHSDDIRETCDTVQSATAVSKTEPQQEPENTEEAENDAAEETPSKSATASGKKKKKKKRAKKKGGSQDNKNQQKGGTAEENGKTEQVIEPAAINSEATIKPDIQPVEETRNQSKMDGLQNEEDKHEAEEVDTVKQMEPEPTGRVSQQEDEPGKDPVSDELQEETMGNQTLEEMEGSASTENPCLIDSLSEVREDHDMDVHNEELKEMAGSADAVEPTEVKTPNEMITDGADDEKTLGTEKVEEMESVTSPDPETHTPPDIISSSKESTSDLDKDCTLSGDNCNREPISTNGDGNHKVSEITDHVEDEVESTVDMKCECVGNNSGDSLTTSSEDNTEADACLIIGESESESISKSESKDNTSVPLPTSADATDGFKSSSDSEPPAVMNSSSDNSLIEVPYKEPTEAAEAITDDGGAKIETEPECLPPPDASPSEGGDDSGLEQARPEREELNEDKGEPKGASLDDEKHESDGETFDTEEAVDEQVDDAANETLERVDQTDASNAEVPLKTGHNDAVLDTSSSPTEGIEIGSSTEQDRALVEDTEHKNSQDEESESPCCPLAEELCESSQDKCDNTDSSQPAEVKSDEEDGEDEEGQSFDFDDMDVEAAIVSSLPDNSEQEEIEEAVDVLSDESNLGSSGLCQSNTESNENTRDKPAESRNEEEKESNMPQENSVTNEEDTSEKVGNISEDQKNASKEEMGGTDEQTHVTENIKVLHVGELNAVPENSTQAPSPLEEGLDAIKHEVQAEGLPKSTVQDSSKEVLQSGRDGKKSSKKGKGKSKEECKMS